MHPLLKDSDPQYRWLHALLVLVSLPPDKLVALLQPHADCAWAHRWNGELPRVLLDALGVACHEMAKRPEWLPSAALVQAHQNFMDLLGVMREACVGVECERRLLHEVEALRSEPQWRLVARLARRLVVAMEGAACVDLPLDVPAILLGVDDGRG